MTLPLTTDTLRAAYDLLGTTLPFKRWNLPDSEDVTFKVVRDRNCAGWHKVVRGKHVIAISSSCVGQVGSLIEVMAHEKIHVHENQAGACGSGEHSAAFKRWAAQVCKLHGFDPRRF